MAMHCADFSTSLASTLPCVGDSATGKSQVICVTGANGFLGSHIVQKLLENGHTVHGTVRETCCRPKLKHLNAFQGAAQRLKLFSTGDLSTVKDSRFDIAFADCDAVIHTATDVNFSATWWQDRKTPDQIRSAEDEERDGYQFGLLGLQEVLDAVEHNLDGKIKTLVLTSSTAAIEQQETPPKVFSEEDWSDEGWQKSMGNWYGATKTAQERLFWAWSDGHPEVRCVAICPTRVVGPILEYKNTGRVNTSCELVLSCLKVGGPTPIPGGDTDLVDVRDTADMHVNAVERNHIRGRFMSVTGRPSNCGSQVRARIPWSDMVDLMREVYPSNRPWLDQNEVSQAEGQPTQSPRLMINSRMGWLLDLNRLRSVKDSLEEFRDFAVRAGLLP